MITVLRQKENHQKSTNSPHVVSNFTKRRLTKIRFPAIVEDSRSRYPKCCISFPLSKQCSLSNNQQKCFKTNICCGFETYFRSNLRANFPRKRNRKRIFFEERHHSSVFFGHHLENNKLCNRFSWFPGFRVAFDFLDRVNLGQITL